MGYINIYTDSKLFKVNYLISYGTVGFTPPRDRH